LTPDPLDWLLRLELLGMKFGLENMHRLVAALGHPERQFKSVHVAGTNGKGSVTAMVEHALNAADFRSARYTSPHLERIEERFVIRGTEVETDTLRDVVGIVRDAVTSVRDRHQSFSPTFFECATAAAFELFRRERVEFAVIETGLGGRLDATNVIEPVITAITSIDFDHEALLGGTIRSIAAEKAGTIKRHVPVVVGPLPAEADIVIQETAERREAPLIRALPLAPRWSDVKPALAGSHQRENAAVAIAILDRLRRTGLDLSEADIRTGVEAVNWPGRLERIERDGTTVLIDGAHNPAGARALAKYLSEIGWSDAALVFGAMRDKNTSMMLGHLLPAVSAIVCTKPNSPRAEEAGLGNWAGRRCTKWPIRRVRWHSREPCLRAS
jgi:dihydrofolate synthase / folylpolyglutamate synthase